jgi:hypothetical protein
MPDAILTVFGEWCGPGVEPGMAVSNLPNKIFAVFGLMITQQKDNHTYMLYTPEAIRIKVSDIPNVYILPWSDDKPVDVDFNNQDSIDGAVRVLNTLVSQVEGEDPWIKSQFGISGLGEGLVFYPYNTVLHHLSIEQVLFKAKGEKHRTVKAKASVQSKPVIASGVDDFVSMVLTEARLLQGVRETSDGTVDMKNMSKFLAWVQADVKKETLAEQEAAGLTWEQVAKPLQAKAREWFQKNK